MIKVLTRLGYRQESLDILVLDQLGGLPRLQILFGRTYQKKAQTSKESKQIYKNKQMNSKLNKTYAISKILNLQNFRNKFHNFWS